MGFCSFNKRQCYLLQSLFSSSLLLSLLTELRCFFCESWSWVFMLDIMFLFVTKCNVLKCLVPLGLKLVKGNSFPHPFLHNHTQFCNITLYARTINDMISLLFVAGHPLHSYSIFTNLLLNLVTSSPRFPTYSFSNQFKGLPIALHFLS